MPKVYGCRAFVILCYKGDGVNFRKWYVTNHTRAKTERNIILRYYGGGQLVMLNIFSGVSMS